MTTVEEISAGEGITEIEKHMLDNNKFYPFILGNMVMMRTITHPLNFIRVRQQVQISKSLYNGTFDAFCKIRKMEGLRAFTKGGILNYVQALPSLLYVNVLESTKSHLKHKTKLKNSVLVHFMGGFTASFTSAPILLPLEIAYQHLIIDGNLSAEKDLKNSKRIFIPAEAKKRRFGALRYIYSYIYQKEGVKGLWKGSYISILFTAFNSGLWWSFYASYRDGIQLIPNYMPNVHMPTLLIQAVAGILAGNTTALCTNWIDVIRVRVQTEINTDSEDKNKRKRGYKVTETFKKLWAEDGFRFAWKGLPARLTQTTLISPLLISGYELVKLISVKEEYKSAIKR